MNTNTSQAQPKASGQRSVPRTAVGRSISGCRTDPVFEMSNGDKIGVSAIIDAPEEAVQSIKYVIHAAPGLTIAAMLTEGSLRAKESVSVTNDQPPGLYAFDVLVQVTPQQVVLAGAVPEDGLPYTDMAKGVVGETISLLM